MSEEYEYDDDPLGEHEPKTQKDKSPIGELKPCPFCGANDPYHEISEDEIHVWIACGNCFATSSRVHTEHHTSADFSWNTRPIEDELQRKLDEYPDWIKVGQICGEMQMKMDNLQAKLEIAVEAMQRAIEALIVPVGVMPEKASYAISTLGAALKKIDAELEA